MKYYSVRFKYWELEWSVWWPYKTKEEAELIIRDNPKWYIKELDSEKDLLI